MERGVRYFELDRTAQSETPQERVHRLRCRYATLLREHAADVLSGSAAALDRLSLDLPGTIRRRMCPETTGE
jgi:hypothetical protein